MIFLYYSIAANGAQLSAAGEDGDMFGVLGGLGHHLIGVIGSKGTGAADAEGKGVHGHDGYVEPGDAHGHKGASHTAELG